VPKVHELRVGYSYYAASMYLVRRPTEATSFKSHRIRPFAITTTILLYHQLVEFDEGGGDDEVVVALELMAAAVLVNPE